MHKRAHNIVTNFFFSGFRHLKVDDILIFHHLINLFLGDVQSQLFLCLCQGNPQFVPCGEFLLLGEMYFISLLAYLEESGDLYSILLSMLVSHSLVQNTNVLFVGVHINHHCAKRNLVVLVEALPDGFGEYVQILRNLHFPRFSLECRSGVAFPS